MKLNNVASASKLPTTMRWHVPNWNSQSEPPWIDIEPAVSTNPKFLTARMAWEKSSDGQALTRNLSIATATPAKLNALREADYSIYAKIVQGWGNLVEDDGKKVEFDPAKAEEVLRALGDHNFDALRKFAQAPESSGTVESIAGN